MALRNEEIGQRLAWLREQKGNPPQEVVAAEVGVSYRSYQAWETGETKPSWRNLTKLAEYYGVAAEFILIGGDDVVESTSAPADEVDDLAEGATASERFDRIEAMLAELLARTEPAPAPIDEGGVGSAEGDLRAREHEEALRSRERQQAPPQTKRGVRGKGAPGRG